MAQDVHTDIQSKKEQLRVTAFQMLRFAVVGIIATAIHYVVYLHVLHFFSEGIAYSIGYAVSFVCNFILTCLFTFRRKASAKLGAGFVFAHTVNYFLQVSLLKAFLWIGVSNTIAPIHVYCIAVPVNFVLVRYVFKQE